MSGLHLFDAFGIELEYMLVDRDSLEIQPSADKVLWALNGGVQSGDFEAGPITWSNELALHVIELKTTRPATRLSKVVTQFENAIAELRPTLESQSARLLPTGMHPWMQPAEEAVLWPHEYSDVYQTYDRIFNCRTHGWTNVQSVHLNLPFSGDGEFAKLHAAVRLLLPILPALTASSPIVERQRTGLADNRLRFYAEHCEQIPSMTGSIIPEPIYDEATYAAEIFGPIKADIKPHDPDEVMDHSFLNARGAIARFDRGSIEIRLMDVQEYPLADIAICGAVIAIAKMLVHENWCSTKSQQQVSVESLRAILEEVIVGAEKTVIRDEQFLVQFGVKKTEITAGELWALLIKTARKVDSGLDSVAAPLEIIQQHGTLSTRILEALGNSFTQDDLRDVYAEIGDCLYRWEAYYAS